MVVGVKKDTAFKLMPCVSSRGAAMKAALPARPHSGRTSDQSRARRKTFSTAGMLALIRVSLDERSVAVS